METKIGMVQNFSEIQKLWQNRRWANGLRVEYFPRIQYVAAQWRSQKFTVEIRWDTREFHRKKHVHVDVQQHFLWIKRQWKRMHWEKVVLYQWRQSTRRMVPCGGEDVSGIRRKRTSNFPCYKSIVTRNAQKQRWWKMSIHYSADLETIETIFSHNCFCKSAQSLWSSRRNMWRVRNPSRSIGGNPL